MPTPLPPASDTTPTAPHPTITPPARSAAADSDAPLWARVDRWNLAIVALLITLCLAWFTWAPADRVEAGGDFLIGTLSVLGVIAAVRGHLVAPRSRPSSIPSAPVAPPPPSPPGPAHKRRIGSIDLVLEWILAGLAVVGFVIAVFFSHGCASTGGVAGAVLAAKPVLATSCHIARRACDFVTRGCDLVSPEPDDATAGGDEPPTAPPPTSPTSPDEVAAVPAPVASSEDVAR